MLTKSEALLEGGSGCAYMYYRSTTRHDQGKARPGQGTTSEADDQGADADQALQGCRLQVAIPGNGTGYFGDVTMHATVRYGTVVP